MTNPALASLFSVPQKYYVPGRIRDGYFPRLVAAGLWKAAVEEKSSETPFPREVKFPEKEKLSKNTTLSLAFDKEKVGIADFVPLDTFSHML